jgi:hypothetical protein
MAQIQAGTTYSEGGQVTAANLNNHVGNAILLPGAITEQVNAVAATLADTILLQQSGALKECTLSLIRDLLGVAFTPVNKAGDTMTGALTVPSLTSTGAVTLPSTFPSAAFSATHKSYVDNRDNSFYATLDEKKADKIDFGVTYGSTASSGGMYLRELKILWGVTGSLSPETLNTISFSSGFFSTFCCYVDYTPTTSSSSYASVSKAITAKDTSSFTMYANQNVSTTYNWIAFGV